MKKQIKIEGMSCMHCVGHVKNALMELEGVNEVVVNLDAKSATVDMQSDIDDTKLKEAVEEAGYDVVAIEVQ
jgi:copper ion binding protein